MDKYGSKKVVVLSNELYNPPSSSKGDGLNVSSYFANFNNTWSDQDHSDIQTELDTEPEQELDVDYATATSTPMENLEPCSETIIEAVRSRPPLWNIRDSNYKNRIIRSRLWEEVTKESRKYCLELICGEDLKDLPSTTHNINRVRKYWDTIKASYIRSKKRKPSGNAGGKPEKDYKYSKLLSFLEDTHEPRRSIELCGNIPEISGSSKHQEGLAVAPMAKNRKRKSYQEETLELRRQFVAIESKKLATPPTSCCCHKGNPPDALDLELDAFCNVLKPYLKKLYMLRRLQTQQDILKVVTISLTDQADS